jgi:outer membrane protein
MKNLAVVLSALALVGVIILFGMKMSEQKPAASLPKSGKEQLTDTKGRIAYVNIDTLEAQYEYLKNKKADFEERKKGMGSELERSQKQFEQDYISAERKAQAGTMTQAEYETTAKRLQQMKQSLEAREAALTEKLLKEQDEFNKDLQSRLDKFLAEYNKDKNFDYILSYSKALGLIMLANDQLDITEDVVAGMNEQYKNEGGKEATDKDTKKKNK